jgi:uncharacterized protein YgfB (UPF0149 family)
MKPILSLPRFNEITTALSHTELKLHASQVHGLMSGILCGNFNQDSDWEELVMGEKLPDAARTTLQELYVVSAGQLAEFLFEFEMVMPDEAEGLQVRAEALTVWCQGFLTGLQAAGIPITGRDAGELTEAIDDLVEIAKMNYDQVMDSEEDEEAYIELIEYVRMAAILIYQDLREGSMPQKSAQSGGQLH